jgi:UDP-N-acetylglucosamine transferase subunit ALG13
MIVVSVGTNEAGFDRLLDAVERLGVDEELLVQHGHSRRIEVASGRVVDFLAYDELAAAVSRARAFVTHAGVGSILLALGNGRRPVVMPRLKSCGEAVDDHQLQLAQRFARSGLVTLVESQADLADALESAHHSLPPIGRHGDLARELAAYIDGVVGRTPTQSAA